MKLLKSIPLIVVCATVPVLIAADAETGTISYYSSAYDGRTTFCKDTFSNDKMTAAHRTLPCGTRLKVTNTKNDKSVIVTVTDRGPTIKSRSLSVTKAAAQKLGFVNAGLTEGKFEVIQEKAQR